MVIQLAADRLPGLDLQEMVSSLPGSDQQRTVIFILVFGMIFLYSFVVN